MTDAPAAFSGSLWPSRTLVLIELDPDDRITAINGPGRDLGPTDPVGTSVLELVGAPQRVALAALLGAASSGWTGMTAGLAPDENGVPVDFDVWVRRNEGGGALMVAEPQVHGVAALNAELLRLNDQLVDARRDAARAADAERRARGRAEATSLRLRNVQRIVDTGLIELSLDELLEVLLDRLAEATTADALEAFLVDDLDGRLKLRAQRGLGRHAPDDTTFSAVTGIPGATLSAGKPLRVAPLPDDGGISRAMAARARSLVAVPLIAHDRPLGVLLLGSADEDAVAEEDVEMLELAAERIGVAIERVLAFERERRIASALQDTLMPGPIPELPGLEVAARYRPAGRGHRVGGDFYDIFALPDDRRVAVVGDVRGKGAEAAARTALVRSTVRALAPREESPAALLHALNGAMLDQSGDHRRHCSMVCAVFEQVGGGVRIDLASGGHPLPLVLHATGEVSELGAPGSLIGLLDDVTFRNCAAELAPGDVALFYTDGVTEARRGRDLFGESRLRELLATSAGLGPAQLAERVERAADDFSDGPLRDDVAIVAVRAVGA